MSLLFLKVTEKNETNGNIQISTSSFLNKTNVPLKQETVRVVTIAMICYIYIRLENFITFRSFLKTESNIYYGVFCENNKLLTKKSIIVDVPLSSKYASAVNCFYLLIYEICF